MLCCDSISHEGLCRFHSESTIFNDGPVSLSGFSGAAPDEGQTTTSVNIMAHSSKDIQKLPSLPEGSPVCGRQARIRNHIDFEKPLISRNARIQQ